MQAIDLGEAKVERLAKDCAGFGDNAFRYFRGHSVFGPEIFAEFFRTLVCDEAHSVRAKRQNIRIICVAEFLKSARCAGISHGRLSCKDDSFSAKFCRQFNLVTEVFGSPR
jgi:hypothetical protein